MDDTDYAGAPAGALGLTNEEFAAVRPVPFADAFAMSEAARRALAPYLEEDIEEAREPVTGRYGYPTASSLARRVMDRIRGRT